MSEKLHPFPLGDLSEAKLVRAIEVRPGLKNVAVIIEYTLQGKTYQGLYRPEKTIKFTPDDRIPVPQELNRDIAYSLLDSQLNWHTSLPVVSWTIKPGDQGALRPYLPDAVTQQQYFYEKQENMSDDYYWLQVAIIDYIAGVIDRNAGDILYHGHNRHTIDSGLSFVSGEEFIVDHDLIRRAVRGTKIPFSLYRAVEILKGSDLESTLGELLPEEGIYWLRKRLDRLLDAGVTL